MTDKVTDLAVRSAAADLSVPYNLPALKGDGKPGTGRDHDRITIYVHREFVPVLKAAAARDGISLSEWARQALAMRLRKEGYDR